MKPTKTTDLSAARWHRSSYSNGTGGDCVEITCHLAPLVPVRDSKDPTGPVLLFQRSAWAPFLDALKNR
ncbi:DUF397 domain-containing protein [Streptomyces sp. NPDC056160]|uniref:DUF397 domain-containing protein n=1 Tax=Streptomyces sp. NPDC056160 TaxID=3345731 RepID=UPI0035D9AFD3